MDKVYIVYYYYADLDAGYEDPYREYDVIEKIFSTYENAETYVLNEIKNRKATVKEKQKFDNIVNFDFSDEETYTLLIYSITEYSVE